MTADQITDIKTACRKTGEDGIVSEPTDPLATCPSCKRCLEWCGCDRLDDERERFREFLQRASEIVATIQEK